MEQALSLSVGMEVRSWLEVPGPTESQVPCQRFIAQKEGLLRGRATITTGGTSVSSRIDMHHPVAAVETVTTPDQVLADAARRAKSNWLLYGYFLSIALQKSAEEGKSRKAHGLKSRGFDFPSYNRVKPAISRWCRRRGSNPHTITGTRF